MATVKSKNTGANPIQSWNDVSAALASIGKLQRAIERTNLDAPEKIDAIMANAHEDAVPLANELQSLEKQVKKYVEAHKDELGEKKSRELYFGSVAFRETKKVRLPGDAKALAEIVIRLRARGMTECIKSTPETILRDPLARYSAQVVKEVGATLTVKDSFSYKINTDRIISEN